MAKTTPQLDICSGTRIDAASRFLKRIGPIPSLRAWARFGSPEAKHGKVGNRVAVIRNSRRKICTADELHYVSVHNSDWRLALWRYLPSSKVFTYAYPYIAHIYACSETYIYVYVEYSCVIYLLLFLINRRQ